MTNRGEADQVAQEASDTQILINNAGFAGYSGVCFNYSEETARQELEDITTDGFTDNFVKNLRLDPKVVEKDIRDFVHQMAEDF